MHALAMLLSIAQKIPLLNRVFSSIRLTLDLNAPLELSMYVHVTDCFAEFLLVIVLLEYFELVEIRILSHAAIVYQYI